MDALSGNTSQATFGTIVNALRGQPRDTGIDLTTVWRMSDYWEAVRAQYLAFESGMQAPSSEVYLHEMPGGQFTNLKAQARSMGLEERWHEVAQMYADVNAMFGDIVKVTPSSKVVGDMALMMVSQGLTVEEVADPDHDLSFPESVVGMMRGDLGQPPDGWPEALQRKILKGEPPLKDRPGKHLAPVDLEAARAEVAAKVGETIDDEDLNGYLMYPKVFTEYAQRHQTYGPVRSLPTPAYFYGMAPGEEVEAEIDPGKTLNIRLQAVGETQEDGEARVFFELNGAPRVIRVPDRTAAGGQTVRPKAEIGNADHIGAPMPGVRRKRRGAAGRPCEGRGSAPDDRGDEDGDRDPRGTGCHDRGAPRRAGGADRRQGPPAGAVVGSRAARPPNSREGRGEQAIPRSPTAQTASSFPGRGRCGHATSTVSHCAPLIVRAPHRRHTVALPGMQILP